MLAGSSSDRHLNTLQNTIAIPLAASMTLIYLRSIELTPVRSLLNEGEYTRLNMKHKRVFNMNI